MSNEDSEFGCDLCWPEAADAAWEAIQKTDRGEDLTDESHLHIMVCVCSHCSQHYLWVFTEKIDWAAGDDPQHWAVLPLTEAEVKSRSYPLNYYPTERLHPERRSLQADFPGGEGKRIFWSTGLYIERHD